MSQALDLVNKGTEMTTSVCSGPISRESSGKQMVRELVLEVTTETLDFYRGRVGGGVGSNGNWFHIFTVWLDL